MNHKRTRFTAKAALLAAAYAGLTWASAAMGLAYGSVQFRLSEALTILPVFTPAAIPGLTLGCALANLTSTISPADILIGTLATLLQAVLTRALRNIRCKNIPLLSLVMPVPINGVFVALESAWFGAANGSFGAVFWSTFLTVAAGEALVCLCLAFPLYLLVEKRPSLKRIIES